ncbi:MAG: hypothetical protein ACRD36_11910 [Candidatus Acidiferrum sp.]
MNFIGRVMRFLFWLLILSWSVALLRRAVRWMLGGAAAPGEVNEGMDGAGQGAGNAQNETAARRLVRDPVCGMHVAEELSIPLREGGELVHFCSVDCRDKYVKNAQRMAANG